MKRNKIIGIACILIFVIIIIIASSLKLEDTHLRVDGIRVRIPEQTIQLEKCDEENAIYCKKIIKVDDKDQVLEVKYIDFKENGYPNTLIALLNGKEFYRKENINIEENYSDDFQTFSNISVIDKYIILTIKDGSDNRTTTLYALDLNGNKILEEYEIDEEDMKIKDSASDAVKVIDNVIKVYASRFKVGSQYKGESICYAPLNDVVEAWYTYTYKDNKFVKEQIEKITAKDFRINNNVSCVASDVVPLN